MGEITSEDLPPTCASRCVPIRGRPWVFVVIVTHLVTQPLTPCHLTRKRVLTLKNSFATAWRRRGMRQLGPLPHVGGVGVTGGWGVCRGRAAAGGAEGAGWCWRAARRHRFRLDRSSDVPPAFRTREFALFRRLSSLCPRSRIRAWTSSSPQCTPHRWHLGVHFGQVPAVDAGSLTTLVGVAGLTFILKVGGGLYWLIPAAVVSLVGARSTRGLFVVRVTS